MQHRSRRTALAVMGSVITTGLAGCLGPSYDGEAANEFGYETTENADVEVPLVPIDDALDWYHEEAALFVDTRGETAFETARIEGALHSEAPDGSDDDPVEAHSTDSRIVTYCDCPHHLATLRGAALIDDGFEHTYALDEGFVPWQENGYPMAGTEISSLPTPFELHGETGAEHAGEFAWAWHDPSGQREATPIREDGSFELVVRFHDLRENDPLRVQTPAAETTGTVAELSTGRLRL